MNLGWLMQSRLVRFAIWFLLLRQVQFLIIGGSCYLFASVMLYLFYYLLELDRNYANFLKVFFAAPLNFALNYVITWRDRMAELRASSGKFTIVTMGSVAFDLWFFDVLTASLVEPLIANTIITALTTVYNYILKHNWVFAHGKKAKLYPISRKADQIASS